MKVFFYCLLFLLPNITVSQTTNTYISVGIPERIANQITYIQTKQKYVDKNIFVVDTTSKLLYLFNKKGKFIAKTQIISGVDPQSKDPKLINQSLLSWDEMIQKIGFKWNDTLGYVDQTNKGRVYSDDMVYDYISKTNTRFLPKGIYVTSNKIESESEFYGTTNNILWLFRNGKELPQAIHAYYPTQTRTETFKKVEPYISVNSDSKVTRDYFDVIKQINMSQSFGCINVPPSFLPYLRRYGVNSYVFNLGEGNDYLIK